MIDTGQSRLGDAEDSLSLSPLTLPQLLQTARTAPCLIAEAEKLEARKAELWLLDEAAPEQGVPPAMLDLATAYSNLLRLRMTMLRTAPSLNKRKTQFVTAPQTRPAPASETPQPR